MTTQAAAPAPVCTATERIQHALYELTLQRGLGIFDLGKITAKLQGANECEGHYAPPEPAPFALTHYRPPFIGRGIPQ